MNELKDGTGYIISRAEIDDILKKANEAISKAEAKISRFTAINEKAGGITFIWGKSPLN